ncbi:MAG: magnesium transporter [Oscillospiraceae bacterium]|jgi:magnesium transporter|nr:magnesium transporter [Oscillospiraceae bacterium]
MEALTLLEEINEALEAGRLAALRALLRECNVVDIAAAMEELSDARQLRVFRILPKDISADVFAYLESDTQEQLVRAITDKELGALIDDLYLDDAVDFLEEVPANVVRRVLALTDAETRAAINRFMSYPEDSVGSVMTNEMITLHDSLTVGEAILQIRRAVPDKETVYTCYVIGGRSRKLLGALPLHRILQSSDDTKLTDIMEDDRQLFSVRTMDDREVAVELARKYDLLSVPVVDSEERLVGIVTIDDIIDVIEEEETEDWERMAALHPSDDEYVKTGVLRMARNRLGWLLILMISASFTGAILQRYEALLAALPILIASIPLLTDTGGNAGCQASTLIIRSMAVGELDVKDFFYVLWKEIRVALLCGAVLAAVNFGRMMLLGNVNLWQQYLVISCTIIFTVLTAKVIGCLLPMFSKFIKIDPALMTGPMLTTVVDIITLLIYCALASAFLLK